VVSLHTFHAKCITGWTFSVMWITWLSLLHGLQIWTYIIFTLSYTLYVLWRNCPMWEVIEFRNLKERDCATVAERRRVLPLHPSPIFAPVLLDYAVTIVLRNSKEGQTDLSDVTLNNTQRCVLRVLDSSVDRRDWRQCSASCC
jgi:hypothetical protein